LTQWAHQYALCLLTNFFLLPIWPIIVFQFSGGYMFVIFCEQKFQIVSSPLFSKAHSASLQPHFYTNSFPVATFEFQREKTKNGIFPKITSWENFSVIKTNSISLGTIF